eukprot:jgi/Psemu1/54644/gm1.54644_g
MAAENVRRRNQRTVAAKELTGGAEGKGRRKGRRKVPLRTDGKNKPRTRRNQQNDQKYQPSEKTAVEDAREKLTGVVCGIDVGERSKTKDTVEIEMDVASASSKTIGMIHEGAKECFEDGTKEISTVRGDCQIFGVEEMMKDWKGVAQQQAHNNLE